MAWKCQRCQKRIFTPREGAFKYAMEWKYVKKRNELSLEFRRLQEIKDGAVVTHVHCDAPQVDGFIDRIKSRLGIPEDADHPLLI